jgi:hypothetical protein
VRGRGAEQLGKMSLENLITKLHQEKPELSEKELQFLKGMWEQKERDIL